MKRTPHDRVNELMIWVLKPFEECNNELIIGKMNQSPSGSTNAINRFNIYQKINLLLILETTSEFSIQIINVLLHS